MNLRHELQYRDAYIKTLEQERAQLYKRLGETGGFAKRIRQAHEDALLLCLWRAGGIHPARRYAMHHGMSHRQWQNAFALCRLAGLVARHYHWVDATPETVRDSLQRAVKHALTNPGAFDKCLNRHGIR